MTVTELAMIEPYGDVMYADPGYRDDRKRYPINTKAHVRAAWAYINMPKNSGKYTSEQLDLIKGRIKAAAARHGIEIAEDNPHTGPSAMGLENSYQSTILAGAAPLAPPAAWFTNPGLSAPTKLTIQEDGHIFGHLAQWRVCHVGIGNSCVVAPKSRKDYGLFKIGSVVCDDGTQVPIGKIVMGTAHANAQWGVMPARDFYDNTAMTAAVITVGEDRHGIWVNGALTTNMTPEKIAELRASALSGDWRTVDGHLELIAALAVNSPGFPIYREFAGQAFSMQAIGVLGTDDDVTGEFSMSDDNSASEFVAPPTGVADEDQRARFSRLQEIEQDWEQDQRRKRFAQLAVLDEGRESMLENHPRARDSFDVYAERTKRIRIIGEPENSETDEE